MNAIVQKSYALKLASVDQAPGEFLGTALVYNERDSLGDSIRDSGGSLPCLWSHDPREVLGTIHVEADARSLSVRGTLLVDDVPRAKEVYALLRAKSVKGLSVGFLPIRAVQRQDGSGTEFVEGRLIEISLTSVPAYQSATITEVRNLEHLARSLDAGHHREALKALHCAIGEMLGKSGPGEISSGDLLDALGKFDPGKWV